MPPPSFFGRHGNVPLYVPNLIGYARVLFAFAGFAVANSSPSVMIAAYGLSFVCDELDGRFARKLGQTSTLGQVLDMVTDRVSTSCLLAVLCVHYPSWQVACLGLLGLDIFSHWFQMFASAACGSSTHKDVRSRSRIIRFYYRNRLFMGFCCICCEVLYLSLYALVWPVYRTPGPLRLPGAVLHALAPFLPDAWVAAIMPGIPIAALLCVAALPGMLIKQMINVVQLKNAANMLVKLDQGRAA